MDSTVRIGVSFFNSTSGMGLARPTSGGKDTRARRATVEGWTRVQRVENEDRIPVPGDG